MLLVWWVGCTADSTEKSLEAYQPVLVQEVSEWNNAVFLSFSRGLAVYEDHCFIPALDNQALVQLDTNLNFIRLIGKEGKGPGEFLGPWQVSVRKDTVFTLDLANKNISFHHLDGAYQGELKLPEDVELTGRIAVNDAMHIFLPTPFSATAIVEVDIHGNEVRRFGTSAQNYLSLRHLFWTDQHALLSIGAVEPVVELYDSTGHLLQSYDFGELPEIINAMQHLKQFYSRNQLSWKNMVVEVIYDAAYANGKLYALYQHHPEQADSPDVMVSNQVLVFRIFPQISLEQKLQLEPPASERFYRSIAVSEAGSMLYGLEYTTKSICKFQLMH